MLYRLPKWLSGKNPSASVEATEDVGSKIPWRRKWQPTTVLLHEKLYEQRSLGSCSPWGGKELDMTATEHACMHSMLTAREDPGSRCVHVVVGQVSSLLRRPGFSWDSSCETFGLTWIEVKVSQSCPTLCNPMDHIVRGFFQARILEWVAFPFSKGSSQPRDRTQVSCITSWATRGAQ